MYQASCTGKLVDDRGSVLLRGRPATQVPGNRLSLRDRLRINTVNIPKVAQDNRRLHRGSPSRSSLHARSGSCVCNEAHRINQAAGRTGT